MNIAVDTNAYSAAARGDPEARAILSAADRIHLPFVVVAELRAGFAVGARGKKNEAALTRFLGSPRVVAAFPDEQTTHHYATLYAYLRAKGTPIPTNDLWIAALVAQMDLVLFTRDAHFGKLPQIARI